MNAPPQHDPDDLPSASRVRPGATWLVWMIVKNVVGWTLIVAAWPVGILLPGPGGIPLFLIGFALVTFPGKRKLTARVLRGRRLELDGVIYTALAAVVSVVIPALLLWFVLSRYFPPHELYKREYMELAIALLMVMAITWLATRLSLRLLNWLIRGIPRVRQRVRPWLRHHGIRLLPPRWRRHHPRTGKRHRPQTEEILLLRGGHFRRLQKLWNKVRRWNPLRLWRRRASGTRSKRQGMSK